jgi:hypothetical protein
MFSFLSQTLPAQERLLNLYKIICRGVLKLKQWQRHVQASYLGADDIGTGQG